MPLKPAPAARETVAGDRLGPLGGPPVFECIPGSGPFPGLGGSIVPEPTPSRPSIAMPMWDHAREVRRAGAGGGTRGGAGRGARSRRTCDRTLPPKYVQGPHSALKPSMPEVTCSAGARAGPPYGRRLSRTPQWGRHTGGVGLGWAGGLMQEQALGCGLPSLPHHEAEQPDCPVPRPSGLSTATRPHRSAGGRKMPSSCV